MNRQRLTVIGHGARRYWNPVDAAQLDGWLDALPASDDARALDVGCGRGTLLVRAVASRGGTGVGVDPNEDAIGTARDAAAARGLGDRIEWRAARFDVGAFAPGSFDLVACLGASHAVGPTPAAALPVLGGLLRPGGHLLFADGAWMREPPPDYLAFLGAGRDDLVPVDAMRARVEAAGFTVVREHVTTPEEWDDYEDGYAANVRAFAAAHPDDPDAAPFLAHIERWHGAYRRWGRGTLGFVAHLARADG